MDKGVADEDDLLDETVDGVIIGKMFAFDSVESFQTEMGAFECAFEFSDVAG